MADVTAKPTRLDDGDSLDEFTRAHELTLVEFYTSGCPKCAAMEPVLGNVARVTDVAVGLINPRDDAELIERFNIGSVPLLVLFRDGTEIARTSEGFQGTDEVLAFLESHAEN